MLPFGVIKNNNNNRGLLFDYQYLFDGTVATKLRLYNSCNLHSANLSVWCGDLGRNSNGCEDIRCS